MIESRDLIDRLFICLDSDIQKFTLYASQLEERLDPRVVQKLAIPDRRLWAYEIDGVTFSLYCHGPEGVMIHTVNGAHDEFLRAVAKNISDSNVYAHY